MLSLFSKHGHHGSMGRLDGIRKIFGLGWHMYLEPVNFIRINPN